jgi:2-polyprenyl-3-methyl-5-hydroxy-6-metoxy-1,4-benzoquinol methylase
VQKNICNLIVIKGESGTGKTVLSNTLSTILPNSTVISTDWIEGQTIQKNIITNLPKHYSRDEKSKFYYGNNLGILLKKLDQDAQKKLYNIIDLELETAISNHSSVITEGYLWTLPEYQDILSKYSNICFIKQSQHFKSAISLNSTSILVDGRKNIANSCNLIIKTIKEDAIKRVIPMYGWYQEFDFLHGQSTSRSNQKLAALNLPQDMTNCNVLDIGCNTGFFAIECDKRGAEVIGIESLEMIVNVANLVSTSIYFTKKITFHVMNINDDLTQLGTFSYILVLGLFHYLNNQEEIINKLISILKPDGVLKLEIGIFPTNTNETEVLKNKYYPTESKLKEMLKNYNFTINPSVNQVGDKIPRFIVSVTKNK